MSQKEATSGQERAGLRRRLAHEHEHLDQIFEDLLAALRGDAREEAARSWSEFDEALTRHMAFEERQLLPAFEAAHPGEAAALVAEHAQIRSMLIELGIGVDLHLARADVVTKFVELLRRHAAREDALLYRWAEQELPAAASFGNASSGR